MGIKCKLGFHNWDGCKCTDCGKIRDEQHDWKGCKCLKCDKTRDEQHDWSKDCKKCAKCNKTSDEDHNWNGCICTKCAKDEHEWIKDSKYCICAKCGLKQKHNWSSEEYMTEDESPLIHCLRCHKSYTLVGKTVVAAGYSLVAPLNTASEHDRSFRCTGIHPWGGCSGFWLVDGTPGSTATFNIEKVLD
jgi:hypothetical protein